VVFSGKVDDGVVGIWGNVMLWHEIRMVQRFEVLGMGIDGDFLVFFFDKSFARFPLVRSRKSKLNKYQVSAHYSLVCSNRGTIHSGYYDLHPCSEPIFSCSLSVHLRYCIMVKA
jgi:hypothetical protein